MKKLITWLYATFVHEPPEEMINYVELDPWSDRAITLIKQAKKDRERIPDDRLH